MTDLPPPYLEPETWAINLFTVVINILVSQASADLLSTVGVMSNIHPSLIFAYSGATVSIAQYNFLQW